MKTAIIIHGSPDEKEFRDANIPSPSNFQWLPWLQKQLSLKNVVAQTPEMPAPYNPVYEEWKQVFEQFKLDGDTMLVGHSCGGGFLVRWLSENKTKVDKVVLVAPWLDPEKELKTGFFDFEIDKDFPARASKVVVMYSTDDEAYITDSINLLKEKLVGAEFREFANKGHFCFEKFPEILPELER